MSDGAVRFMLKDIADTHGEVKNELGNGKRSFTITISDDGQIEVAPGVLGQQQVTQPKAEFREKKVTRAAGKQRIRIALIEEDAGSSDEEEEHDESYVVLNGLAKTNNKNVPGKPSFVVLEDKKVRKRFEDILQASACLCNAQQQTSPCDIGAHTGSQTDDVLRHHRVDAHSRGCQVTDARCNLKSAAKKKNLNSLNQLRIMQALQQLNDQSLTATTPPAANVPTTAVAAAAPTTLTSKATTVDAPHITISLTAPPSATPSVAFHPQMGLQQVMPTCCPNCLCGKCCSCCGQQLLPPCMQHRNLAGATTCCSSCSSLRPPLAQTVLGPCAAPCLLPEPTAQQRHHQQQDYRIPSWTPQPFTPCPNCPLNPCNMCTCGNPNCPYCCMRRNCSCCSIAHQQETQKQQQQQHQQLIQRAYSKSISNMQAKKAGLAQPNAPSDVPKQDARTKKNAKSKQAILPKEGIDVPFTGPKFSYPKIARRLLSHYPRHRAGGIKASSSSSKLYVARFGRTCLILKPTVPDATEAGDHDSPK